MLPLLGKHAPEVPVSIRNRANSLGHMGEIAVVGLAAPYGERSPSHRERFVPGAFGDNPEPPFLLGEHTAVSGAAGKPPAVVGMPTYAESVIEGRCWDGTAEGGGLWCLWRVPGDMLAVETLFARMDDQVTGLSVEMRVWEARTAADPAHPSMTRMIERATTNAVAMVAAPSYHSARLAAVVTPGVTWTYHRGGLLLPPDFEPAERYMALRDERDRARRNAERYRESPGDPDPSSRFERSRRESVANRPKGAPSLPPLEYRTARP